MMTSNADKIMEALAGLDICYGTVSKIIPQMLAAGTLTLDLASFVPENSATPNGFGRYLVFDNNDLSNPVSIWAFAFAPGQKTCIHDHLYSCTVTVLTGIISEKFYQLEPDEINAKPMRGVHRAQFDTTEDTLGDDNIVHQLKNRQVEKSYPSPLTEAEHGLTVTLHIYEMPAFKVAAPESQINKNVYRMFHKKSREEAGHLQYTVSSGVIQQAP
jgi:kynureninase